ncbi:MAG: cytochrome c3 family protein, partial [Proteobacteria bacterium]|nr:cytochrome c3 family protein [Pseudomonadota bacterium]
DYPFLLRGEEHYPLKNGGCNACHVQEGKKIGLKYEGSKNCMRCHGQITGTSSIVEADKVHQPVYQVDCIACHNPHLGVRQNLLLEDPDVLCGWCHGILLRGVENLHGVFREKGTCYTCHLPHISDFRPLLKRPQGELCTRCHQEVVPEGAAGLRKAHGVVRDGRCTGCHNPHGTNTEQLLKDSRDALCRGCHPQVTREAGGEPFRFLHGPVGANNCTACHELRHRHGEAPEDGFLRAKGRALCALCHDVPPEHVPERYQGKMREVRNDCLACHVPHGAANSFLIRDRL